MDDSRKCHPPYSHIYLNGARQCECGAMSDDAIAEMLAPEEPLRMLVRVFDALMGEARA